MIGEGLFRPLRLTRMLAALALLAMLVRAVVPAGYMIAPAAAADGGGFLTITLCTGRGAVDAVLDLATGKIVERSGEPTHDAPGEAPSPHDAPCAFAAAAPLAPPALAAASALPVPEAHVERQRPSAAAPGRGLAAPPPWSTGPPSLV